MAPKITGLVLPMLRDRDKLAQYWRQAADTVWQVLAGGEDCAFVNVGDPLLYGTFIYVMDTLKESHPEVPVTVVPGVSSINAAAAASVLPLSCDDDNIAIISGRGEDDGFIQETLERFDTVVFLKVNSIFGKVLGILQEMGLVDKCVYVRRCTTGDEEIVRDIGKLAGQKLDYFSLLIVRK
jgi:precorrin-2/cobalt-factor-2 C20-methyltransferase